MKRFIILLVAITTVCYVNAQGSGKAKKGKGNLAEKVSKTAKDKDKDKDEKQKHENAVWGGTNDTDGGGPKPSKNQPAKVRAAFQRDYPNATSVSWSKYRGDWTATFRNGPFISTAIYHANGDRKDTRTVIPKEQAPVKILDIFKKRTDTKVEDVVKIEEPKTNRLLYRIKEFVKEKTKYQHYDADGNPVEYNY
ncbi:MAG TPA: hypothetical protein VF476_16955 [Chitinophagaceae bacterium]